MSRTRKGSKGPGWEPWSNRHEKALLKAGDPVEHGPDVHPAELDVCPGCPVCICRHCGGHIAAGIQEIVNEERGGAKAIFKCIHCDYAPPEANE